MAARRPAAGGPAASGLPRLPPSPHACPHELAIATNFHDVPLSRLLHSCVKKLFSKTIGILIFMVKRAQ
jgi:hypothetical protein